MLPTNCPNSFISERSSQWKSRNNKGLCTFLNVWSKYGRGQFGKFFWGSWIFYKRISLTSEIFWSHLGGLQSLLTKVKQESEKAGLKLNFQKISTSGPISSVQLSSACRSRPTLCDPMNYSTPGLPVHHQLPEFTQTHIHWASDAIQPSHPLSSPSPPAPNPSQHQSLYQWVNSSHEVAKVLEFQLASFFPKKSQDWSPSEWTGWISLQSKGFPGVFSNATVQKHQFFGAQLSSQSNSHIHTSYHFMANRRGNSGNCVKLYFFGLQNHCRWWLQPWN